MTIRRRAVGVPTETVFATFATDPLPSTTDRGCEATAPSPAASPDFALALAKRPNAEAPSPAAVASVPIAVAAKPVWVLNPTEVPKSPKPKPVRDPALPVVLLYPIATER